MTRPFHRARPWRATAFTLVETLMAVAIAAGTLLTLVALLPAGLVQFRAAGDMEAQARISHYMLDRLQMMDWADLQTQIANGSTAYFPFDNRGTPLAKQGFSAPNSQCSYVARATAPANSNNTTSVIPGDSTAQPWLTQVEIDISSFTSSSDPFAKSQFVHSTIVTLSKLDH